MSAVQQAAAPHRRNQHQSPPTDAEYMAAWKARCDIEPGGCWLWTGWQKKMVGTLNPLPGYAGGSYRGKNASLHRVVLGFKIGRQLVPGEMACHSCDRPNCINPDHLWLGDAKVNMIDAGAKRRWPRQQKTVCAQGHPRTPENLRFEPPNRYNCIPCDREKDRRKWAGPRRQELLARQRENRARRKAERLSLTKAGCANCNDKRWVPVIELGKQIATSPCPYCNTGKTTGSAS